MTVVRWRTHLIGAAAAVALAGSALLLGVLPSHGQGEPPTVNAPVCRILQVNESPKLGITGVSVEFQVPSSFAVHTTPRLRITDDRGEVLALTPMFVQSWGTIPRAYRELPSGIYPSGTYRLTAEFDHRDARGQIGRAVSGPASVVGRGRPRTR